MKDEEQDGALRAAATVSRVHAPAGGEERMELRIEKPNKKQEIMLRSRKRYIAYGGARGGGKSWAVRTKAKLLALGYPGIRELIVRKSYPELIHNHITQLRKELNGIARYNDKDKVFKFPIGSAIEFAYAENDKSLERLQGVEYDVIFVDEATQLTEYQLKIINALCRGVNNFPKRIYYMCNPGGPGMNYIKRLFIDRDYNDDEDPNDFEFIQALVTDNEALMKADPEYIKFLDALPESQKAAWRYGRWDVFAGQFFKEFRDDPQHYADRLWTHVIDPFEPPANWTYYRAFDYGSAKPFSMSWNVVDFDGTIYRILEMYGCTNEPNVGVQWTADQIFEEAHRIETTHKWLKGRRIQGVADRAIWNRGNTGMGVSIAEMAAKHGITFVQGDNDRLNGWDQCRYRLQFNDRGIPRYYVFSNCKAFRRTIPLLLHDTVKVEDVDSDMEDHPRSGRVEVPHDDEAGEARSGAGGETEVLRSA
jgi:phage terminase large subunit